MLTIRADASPGIGTGHVMRCLALAQAAQEQGMPVRVIGRITVPWVLEKLAHTGIPLFTVSGDVPVAELPVDLLAQLGDDSDKGWVVLDGYHFGLDCQQAVRAAGYKLLVIDDYAHLPEYSCDILLNQNIGAEEFCYAGDVTVKLLGPNFALLREEFIVARNTLEERVFPPTPKKILFSLGGGEQVEKLNQIITAFSRVAQPGMEIKAIWGGLDAEKAKKAFTALPCSVEILDNIDDIPSLMLWADYAISAGGSTCWELCCLGTPFTVEALAENQSALARRLQERGIASSLHSLASIFTGNAADLLSGQSEQGRRCVGGDGAAVVIQACLERLVRLRRARFDDRDFLLDMVNDSEIRKFAGTAKNVSAKEHDAWFAARLRSPQSCIFIAYAAHNPLPVGYIRFEESKGRAILSVALAPRFHGRGLGYNVIVEGCRKFAKETGRILCIIAYVREDNPRALRVFEKAGFKRTGKMVPRYGVTLVEMSLLDIDCIL